MLGIKPENMDPDDEHKVFDRLPHNEYECPDPEKEEDDIDPFL